MKRTTVLAAMVLAMVMTAGSSFSVENRSGLLPLTKMADLTPKKLPFSKKPAPMASCKNNYEICSSNSDCCTKHCNEVSGIYVCTPS
jgi:hypothetical protein